MEAKTAHLGFNYGGGYIDKIKLRNSDRFIPMSEAAGVTDVNRGVYVGGGRVSYKGFTFGAIDYYSSDIINIFYTESNYKFALTDKLGLLLRGPVYGPAERGIGPAEGFSL